VDLTEKQFTSAKMAEAAGMSPANFRAYLSRGLWRMIGTPAESNGFGHKFSIHDALGFALARQLVDYGVEPKKAFDRAMRYFAHVGDEDREPGGVFDDTLGYTLYAYSHETGRGGCIATKRLSDAAELLPPQPDGRGETVVLINLNRLRERVFRAFGLDARDYE
jgi:hypothetical protein